MRTKAAKRQMASTMSVKRIRDFSSGILKKLLKVLAIAESMISWSFRGRLYYLFGGNDFTSAAFGFNLGASRGAKGMGADGQLPGQFSAAKNFDAGRAA